MRIVVVIPSCPPGLIIRVNDIISFWALNVAVGKANIRAIIMTITWCLIMLTRILLIADLGIQIGVELN